MLKNLPNRKPITINDKSAEYIDETEIMYYKAGVLLGVLWYSTVVVAIAVVLWCGRCSFFH